MPPKSPVRYLSTEYLFDFPSEQLISAGRLFLTIFALAAVLVDVSSKERDTHEVSVLLAYLAFAALLAVLVLRRPLSPREQICAHLFDGIPPVRTAGQVGLI